MHLGHSNSCDKNILISIDELKALRLLQQKIANNKKARKYISEINERYRKIKDKKSNKFLKNINPFRRAA